MQIDVSMYFATVGTLRVPEIPPMSAAEERRISRSWTLTLTSHFLDLDEEGLVLGSPDVRLEHRGRQEVRERSDANTGESPVDREADLPHVLAVDQHRLQSLGHERLAFDPAARARDSEPLLVG